MSEGHRGGKREVKRAKAAEVEEPMIEAEKPKEIYTPHIIDAGSAQIEFQKIVTEHSNAKKDGEGITDTSVKSREGAVTRAKNRVERLLKKGWENLSESEVAAVNEYAKEFYVSVQGFHEKLNGVDDQVQNQNPVEADTDRSTDKLEEDQPVADPTPLATPPSIPQADVQAQETDATLAWQEDELKKQTNEVAVKKKEKYLEDLYVPALSEEKRSELKEAIEPIFNELEAAIRTTSNSKEAGALGIELKNIRNQLENPLSVKEAKVLKKRLETLSEQAKTQEYVENYDKPHVAEESMPKLSKESIEALRKEGVEAAREMYVNAQAEQSNAQRNKKSWFGKILFDWGIGKNKGEVDAALKSKSLDTARVYNETLRNRLKLELNDSHSSKTPAEKMAFLMGESEKEHKSLAEGFENSKPQKERGAFRTAIGNGWKWWQRQNKYARYGASALLATGAGLGFGVIGVGAAAGYGAYRFGTAVATGAFSPALFKGIYSVGEGLADERFDARKLDMQSQFNPDQFDTLHAEVGEALRKHKRAQTLAKAVALGGTALFIGATNASAGAAFNSVNAPTISQVETPAPASNVAATYTPERNNTFIPPRQPLELNQERIRVSAQGAAPVRIEAPLAPETLHTEHSIQRGGSLWRSVSTLLRDKPTEFGFRGNISNQAEITQWVNRTTGNILASTPEVSARSVVHPGDTLALTANPNGVPHVTLRETSGWRAGIPGERGVRIPVGEQRTYGFNPQQNPVTVETITPQVHAVGQALAEQETRTRVAQIVNERNVERTLRMYQAPGSEVSQEQLTQALTQPLRGLLVSPDAAIQRYAGQVNRDFRLVIGSEPTGNISMRDAVQQITEVRSRMTARVEQILGDDRTAAGSLRSLTREMLQENGISDQRFDSALKSFFGPPNRAPWGTYERLQNRPIQELLNNTSNPPLDALTRQSVANLYSHIQQLYPEGQLNRNAPFRDFVMDLARRTS